MEFYKPERFEDWESVEAFPDYEVSNTGLVENTRLGHILEPVAHHSGAMVVSMKHESGRFKQAQVKRLVMGAFKKPKPLWDSQHVIGHYNQDQEDCSSYNLYWTTRARQLMLRGDVVSKDLQAPAWLNHCVGDNDILVEQFDTTLEMAQSLGLCPVFTIQKVWNAEFHMGFQFRLGRY